MRKLAVILAVALAAMAVGCQDEAPTSAPKVSELAAERARVAATVKKREQNRGARAKAAAADVAQDPTPGTSVLDTAMGSVEADFVYDGRNKRDPFRSIFWQNRSVDRVVRGPLEQYELGQLAVTAIVWDSNRPRALVIDPGGDAYVVREGSHVGKNDGLVIHIGDNLVLVKETYIDFAGEESTKDVEMKIRRIQGG